MLPGIQLLRGAAALLVVMSHAALMMRHPEYFGRAPFTAPDLGVFGVAIFFVISGFIIAIVSLRADGSAAITPAEFGRRRFIRIVPFMWLCAIGYNILSYLGTGTVEWGPAVRGLLVWPVGEIKPNVLWSLRHELLFYALFGLTMLGKRQRPALLIGWFIAPVLLWSALLPFDRASATWHPYNNEWLRVLLLGSDTGANLQLGTGFMLGMAWLRHVPLLRERAAHSLWLCIVLTAIGAIIVTWTAVAPGLGRTLLWTALATIIVYSGIVARVELGALRSIGTLLGNASFSIYLVHNPILLVLLQATRVIDRAMAPGLWLVIYCVVMVLGGIAVYHLVERPLIAWLLEGRWRSGMTPPRSARP